MEDLPISVEEQTGSEIPGQLKIEGLGELTLFDCGVSVE